MSLSNSGKGSSLVQDQYEKMYTLRSDLFPQFSEYQSDAATSIYNILHTLIYSGQIETIIDLGCGTGEIIEGIKVHVQNECSSSNNVKYNFIGIDCDGTEIDCAKNLNSDILFFVGNAEDCVTLLKSNNVDINWSKTCLLMTGHTLPHFDMTKFKNILINNSPKYVFFDLFYTFDDVIYKLKNGQNIVNEEKRLISTEDKSVLYVTRTSLKDESKGDVLREIYKFDLKTCKEPEFPEFSVSQRLMDSRDFCAVFESHNYMLEMELDYAAGYGFMDGFFYVNRCKRCDELNNAYYCAVDNLIERLLSKDNLLDKLRRTANIVTAVVILPFDHHFTFARYSRLPIFKYPKYTRHTKKQTTNNENPVDADIIPKFDMQLDYPRYRKYYPMLPAPAIHACLLGKGSLANVLSLEQHDEISKKALGTDPMLTWIKEETAYLKTCSNNGGPHNNDHETPSLFFLIPFFVGYLPVFCFVVDCGEKLPIKSTMPSLYEGHLRNWHEMVKANFTPIEIDKFFFDFISRVKNNLSDFSNVDLNKAIELAKNKPWKSWLHAVPTKTIKDSILLYNQEQVYSKTLVQVIDYVTSKNIIEKDSLWLQKVTFFSVAHEGPRNLAKAADIGKKLITLLEVADISGAKQKLTSMIKSLENDHYESNWLYKNLLKLLDCKYSYPYILTYLKIKSTHCRVSDNTGKDFRFSPLRLLTYFEMYSDHIRIKLTNIIQRESNEELRFVDKKQYDFIKVFLYKDYSDSLKELIEIIAHRTIDPTLKIVRRNSLFEFTLQMPFNASLTKTNGQAAKRLRDWITQECNIDSIPDEISGLQVSFKINIKLNENGKCFHKSKHGDWVINEAKAFSATVY